ncbi:MAG: Thivi_2564 family membrane protein [Treponemataceae bacterium]
MPLIQLVLVLVVTGVIMWTINSFIPMSGSIKNILNAVVVIVVVLYVLRAFGVLNSVTGFRVGW